MEQQKKKRGENWSSEEKKILRHLIAQSAHIVEDKSTKTSVYMQKIKEWKNIQIKFNEISGKCRSVGELKLSWIKMKFSDKSNLSTHRREQTMTGGGKKPPSPSPEDLEIIAIAPHDFVIEVNDYDSDALNIVPVPTVKEMYTDPKPGPSFEETKAIQEENPEQHIMQLVGLQDTESTRINSETVNATSTTKKRKKSLQNRIEEQRQEIIETNTDLK